MQVQTADNPIELPSATENINTDNKLTLFPNPVRSGENITLAACTLKTQYAVTSLAGAQIYTGRGNIIDTDGFKSGVYLVTINTGSISQSSKLIVI